MAEELKNGSGAPAADQTSPLLVSARKKQLEQQEEARRAKEEDEKRLAAEAELRRLEQEVQARHSKAERAQVNTDSDAAVMTKETVAGTPAPPKTTKKIGKTASVVIVSLCTAFVVLIIALLVSNSSKIDPNAALDAVVNMESANMGIRYPSSIFALDGSGDDYVSLSTHDPDGAMILYQVLEREVPLEDGVTYSAILAPDLNSIGAELLSSVFESQDNYVLLSVREQPVEEGRHYYNAVTGFTVDGVDFTGVLTVSPWELTSAESGITQFRYISRILYCNSADAEEYQTLYWRIEDSEWEL